ncbi:hypothetical protein VST7929_00413 [Vibrio stylophorae]|uniref:Uncharacterized protein n=1 Tax=Vibrio stylophorae TaxID=659351 RepID=A0ABM8ZQM6_9VIBR|nr:hypothetical protein VST7929_00413 [Vibrio stylophorae]
MQNEKVASAKLNEDQIYQQGSDQLTVRQYTAFWKI